MNEWNTAGLIAADKKYLWHPFTPMDKWCAPDQQPLVLVEGVGALLRAAGIKLWAPGTLQALRRWCDRNRGASDCRMKF